MRRAGAAFLVALTALSLSGCLQPPDCPVPGEAQVMTPAVPGGYLATDPTQAWDTLALSWPNSTEPIATTYQVRPAEGWNVTVDTFPSAPDGPVLERMRVHPGVGGAVLTRSWMLAHDESASVGACHSGRSGTLAWDLRAPATGEVAQPGLGVRLMTAGFWENGTLFYTNIRQLHESAWPRAAWYAWGGSAPLSVYVYDKDRSERGDLWHASTAGTALGAPTGNLTVWDYATTIPGFNGALKGLSTSTTRVVRVAPEEAYTTAGREAHPLYGSALVFYIKLLAVDTLPCPPVPVACGMMPMEGGSTPAVDSRASAAATLDL